MALHLLKLSVGVRDLGHLQDLQAARRRDLGRTLHFTRQMPRRREELLDGGSIYWVIKGVISARQALLDIEAFADQEGRPRTALVLAPELRRTQPRAQRAFQGWRYLDAASAPPDLDAEGGSLAEMPAEMLAELRELGLL